MKVSLDICRRQLNKFGEELCGDTVEVIYKEDSEIVILADGMGSGVKANILSTLTAKILGTMLKNGESVDECVETLVSTLPISKERQGAYSTFAILQVFHDGRAYLAEYDAPACLLIRDGQTVPLESSELEIAGRRIKEYIFKVLPGDTFVLMSDGVTHAGLGSVYPFGWGRTRVGEFAAVLSGNREMTGDRIAAEISGECDRLYSGRAGDDTTVVVSQVMARRDLSLFTGPPKSKEDDVRLMAAFMEMPGVHVVSGGTSATIASRYLGKPLRPSLFYDDPEIPPTAELEGIDLVTEGVLTLNRAVSLLKAYNQGDRSEAFYKQLDAGNGGARLAKLLIEGCTHLTLFVGQAMNEAHQAAGLSFDLSIRMQLVDRIARECREMKKTVAVNYY